MHNGTVGTAVHELAFAGSLNGETRTLLLQVLVKNGQFDTNNTLITIACFRVYGWLQRSLCTVEALTHMWHARCIRMCSLAGNGMWLSKSQSQCLILWKKLPEWAAALHEWALSIGMQDAVTSIEEIMDGEDSVGTGDVLKSYKPCQ